MLAIALSLLASACWGSADFAGGLVTKRASVLGVLLGVNMQTSFMHPPFGFALFFLRSVAPKEDYKDRVTGKLTKAVTTGQIYMGAIPFVIIQVIMIGLVILIPSMVMVYKSGEIKLDQKQIDQQFQQIAPPGGADDNPPPLKF